MARKRKHEEHLNAEAWAIPYGDLVTLLLALFVVMYAMSSVNEGKYRVMSEAMSEAFHGTPRTLKPVQIGDKNERGLGAAAKIDLTSAPPKQVSIGGLHRDLKNPQVMQGAIQKALPMPQQMPVGSSGYRDGGKQALKRIAREVEQAMHGLIKENVILVRRNELFLEIEIKTDILFPSGVADLAPVARPVLFQLGEILKPFDNPLRVEGHTDNRPIATASFPSNWELSSARAASVIHVLLDAQVPASRLSVSGFGEYRPLADNATVAGRNANRRVVLVVLANDEHSGDQIEKALGAQVEPAGPDLSNNDTAAKTALAQPPLAWPLAADPTVRLSP